MIDSGIVLDDDIFLEMTTKFRSNYWLYLAIPEDCKINISKDTFKHLCTNQRCSLSFIEKVLKSGYKADSEIVSEFINNSYGDTSKYVQLLLKSGDLQPTQEQLGICIEKKIFIPQIITDQNF